MTWWLLSKRWAFETFVPSGICQDYCSWCHQMLFLPSYLVACEGEKIQSSHGIQIMSKRWLTPDWFLTVIEVTAMSNCRGEINNILTIIWNHLGGKNRWPKPLICSDALTVTTHVLIKPWAALITWLKWQTSITPVLARLCLWSDLWWPCTDVLIRKILKTWASAVKYWGS